MPNKHEIRKIMLERRQAISAEERKLASLYICEKLLSIPLPKHSIIAGYKAMRGEVDISAALIACHDHRYTISLPSISDPEKIMHFLLWKPKMPMKIGAYGIHEPEGSSELIPDVFFIPMLAFDRSGTRLGYGGGYYDATLAHIRKNNPLILTVGVAFSLQEVDNLPYESHDLKLDFIVTEKEIISSKITTNASGEKK